MSSALKGEWSDRYDADNTEWSDRLDADKEVNPPDKNSGVRTYLRISFFSCGNQENEVRKCIFEVPPLESRSHRCKFCTWNKTTRDAQDKFDTVSMWTSVWWVVWSFLRCYILWTAQIKGTGSRKTKIVSWFDSAVSEFKKACEFSQATTVLWISSASFFLSNKVNYVGASKPCLFYFKNRSTSKSSPLLPWRMWLKNLIKLTHAAQVIRP